MVAAKNPETTSLDITPMIANFVPCIAETAKKVQDNTPCCFRCGYGGCDVRITPCGCAVHSRCINLPPKPPLLFCPHCSSQVGGLALLPMSFEEIDNVKRLNASSTNKKRGKKRKEMSGNESEKGEGDCRTGRWTTEEMAFCEHMIKLFKSGDLPVSEGTKMNDFLSNMLKSKQSRLTKKMKNANLSGKSFAKRFGYIPDSQECKQFSALEDSFFRSISSLSERADVRFHIQKEWREMFSNYCLTMGQPIDADDWLNTMEEKEKRDSMVKDTARLARRKMMMGIALDRDSQNPDQGVFIEPSDLEKSDILPIEDNEYLRVSANAAKGKNGSNNSTNPRPWHYASPFLGQIISFIQRHGYPFEHIDAWAPSFVPDVEASKGSGVNASRSTCRLCFAGSATGEVQIPADRVGPAQLLTREEQFNFLAFAEYSQKFSFNVGCGLPGRVYESGIPAWEQSVCNAPHTHFERCGGAMQYKIKTVVGIPVPSPNVGRIVVVIYSHHDRIKDQEMVGRLYEEFKQLVPSPKWKLVVDIGTKSLQPQPATTSTDTNANANTNITQGKEAAGGNELEKLIALLGEYMPLDPSSPIITHLSGFMSCRLMLLKSMRTPQEEEITRTLLSSYSAYLSSGRANSDIAMMIARDFTFLKQQLQPQNMLTNQLSLVPSAGMNSTAVGSSSFLNANVGSNQALTNQMSHQLPQLTHFDGSNVFLSQQNTQSKPSTATEQMKPARHP